MRRLRFLIGRDRAERGRGCRALRIDGRPQLRCVLWREQAPHGVDHKIGVTERGIAVEECPAHRLDREMHRARRVKARQAEVPARSDVEDFAERDPTAARRGRRDDAIAPIGAIEWRPVPSAARLHRKTQAVPASPLPQRRPGSSNHEPAKIARFLEASSRSLS